MKKIFTTSPKVMLRPSDGDDSDLQSVKRFHDSVKRESIDLNKVLPFSFLAASIVLAVIYVIASIIGPL